MVHGLHAGYHQSMPGQIFLSALREPVPAIAYAMTLRLRADHAGSYLLESDDMLFDVPLYLAAHRVPTSPDRGLAPQISSHFGPPPDEDAQFMGPRFVARTVEGKTHDEIEVARHAFHWRDADYVLYTLTWPANFRRQRRRWLIASDRTRAEAFFEVVCAHNAEVRDEILVFANGCWSKSKQLYTSVRASSFDDLVLAEGLESRVREDFRRFLDSREFYARHRIPYKRGALFLGPPGNGKTLCIKALIGDLDIPCLYVQSFEAPRMHPQQNIKEVFRRARRTAPCLLVLEDLDALVDGKSLSFFLNELDGFATNNGLITIASTNHAERLDPAILQRPSRFDRKYHFELPERAERQRYVERWNGELAEELRLADESVAAVADATGDYSFAYLKELFISSLMRWSAEPEHEFPQVVMEEAAELAKQMKSANVVPEQPAT